MGWFERHARSDVLGQDAEHHVDRAKRCQDEISFDTFFVIVRALWPERVGAARDEPVSDHG